MKVQASFVRSAAVADDFPRDGAAEIALVGRSNVGKSTLINALVRGRVARTSAAPGKTRLANIYRVVREGVRPLYVVDLPGYGFARGDARELEAVTRAFFGRVDRSPEGSRYEETPQGSRYDETRGVRLQPDLGALLLVDARHPGLESDVAAWHWLRASVDQAAIVATKIDKLARGQRIRAVRQLESVFEHPVAPVSAVTGEGLDELWKVIDRLANSNSSSRPRSRSRPNPATARRRP